MTPQERKELGGYHWWHFTPKDNPAMTKTMMRSLEMQFPQGYLYDRYILGLRCIAEGLVYPRDVSDIFEDFDPMETVNGKRAIDVRYCSIDFGQDHPTVMMWGGPYMGNKQDWRIVKEYYDKGSDRTTADYYRDFIKVCQELRIDPAKVVIAIDPAAKALRTEFLNRRLNVIRAKNDVLPGIAYTRSLMYSRRIRFHISMVRTKAEFLIYSWDPKAAERGEDKVIKQNDDCMDTLRYFAYTHIKPLAR